MYVRVLSENMYLINTYAITTPTHPEMLSVKAAFLSYLPSLTNLNPEATIRKAQDPIMIIQFSTPVRIITIMIEAVYQKIKNLDIDIYIELRYTANKKMYRGAIYRSSI